MSSAMRPAPITAAIKETKNRTNPFDEGTAKKVRSGRWPGGRRSGAKNRRTIEVIVVKAAPIAVTTIAAGRRNSRRSPVAIFFQAEDGIRDVAVTGVQTCALPI